MKRIQMKGKTVEEAISSALTVLGAEREKTKIAIISEGKPAMLGVIGGEQAEVEVFLKEGVLNDARQILEEILDKMGFLATVEGKEDETIELVIKGDDLGRIIGKEGATLAAFEVILNSILLRIYGEKKRIHVDAAEYREKRRSALERLALDAAEEVAKTGREKFLPPMEARDRRVVHMFLKEDSRVTTYSTGEGRDRRLVIALK